MAQRRINWKFLWFLIVILAVIALAVGGLELMKRRRHKEVDTAALAKGETAYAEKNWDEAAAQYGKYLTNKKTDEAVLLKYAKAIIKSSKPNPRQVEAALQNILITNPDHWEAKDLLAKFYRDSAEYIFRRYFTSSATPPAAAVTSRNQRLNQLESIAKRMASQQKALIKSSDAGDSAEAKARLKMALEYIAYACLGKKKYEQAEGYYAEIIKLDPTAVEAYRHRSNLQMLLGGNKESALPRKAFETQARAILKECISQNPKSLNAKLYYAFLLAQLYEFGEADRLVKKVEDGDSPDSRLATLLVDFLFRYQGRVKNGLPRFLKSTDKALEIDPTLIRVRMLKKFILESLGKKTEAVALCREGLKHNPDNAQLLTSLIFLLDSPAKLDESASFFETLRKKHPDLALTQFAEATMIYRGKNFSKALAKLNGIGSLKSAAWSPDWDRKVEFLKYQCATANGRHGTAIKHLKALLKKNPPLLLQIRLHKLLAREYLATGDLVSVQAELQILETSHKQMRLFLAKQAGALENEKIKQSLVMEQIALYDMGAQAEFTRQMRLSGDKRNFNKIESLTKKIELLINTFDGETKQRLALSLTRTKAGMYYKAKKTGKLHKLAESIDNLDNGTIGTGLTLAQIEGMAGLDKKAAARLTELRDKQPGNWTVVYSLANVLKDENKIEQALSELRKLLKESPEKARPARTAAFAALLEKKGRAEEAGSLRLANADTSPNALALRAYSYFKTGRREEARKIVSLLKQKLGEDDANRVFLEGMLAWSDNKSDEALSALKKTTLLRPGWPVALYELAGLKAIIAANRERAAIREKYKTANLKESARLMESADKLREEALALLREALDANPAYFEAEILLYRVVDAMGNKVGANEAFLNLEKKYASRPEVMKIAADRMLRKNDLAGAERILKKYLKIYPNNIPENLRLANVYERRKKHSDAEALFTGLINTPHRYNPLVFGQMAEFQLRRPGPGKGPSLIKTKAFLAELAGSGKIKNPVHLALAHLMLGRIQLSLREYNDALRSFSTAVELNPKSSQAFLMKALAYANLRQPDNQMKALRQAADIEEKSGARSARLRLARILLAAGKEKDLKEAELIISKLLSERKGDAEAIELRVMGILRRSTPEKRDADIAECIRLLRLACETNPRYESTRILLFNLLTGAGKQAEAVETLEAGLKANPASTALLLRKADILIKAGTSQAAAELIRQGLEVNPDSFELKRALGGAIAIIDPEGAVSHYRKILAETPDGPETISQRVLLKLDIANLLGFRLNQYEAAEKQMLEAYKLSKKSRMTWSPLINLYAKTNRLEKADKLFMEARNASPSDIGVYLIYAEALVRRLNSKALADKAIMLTTEVLEKAPENPAALGLRGSAYIFLNDTAKALADFRAAYALQKNPNFANNAAWLLAQRKEDMEEALSLSRYAIEKSPDNAECWDTRRFVLIWANRKKEAMEAAKKAAELSGTPKFRLRYAEGLKLAGHKTKAASVAEELKNDPEARDKLTDEQKKRLDALIK